MYTPRSRLRITANHIVDASALPWTRCQGRAGGTASVATPASMSWRWVAT